MSRLDSFIRRLEAQRACLDNAAQLIAAVPGNVLEFGLGNGRTYDHLREQLRGRDIYVFERKVAAHPDCIPPADRLFLGDFLDSLPKAIAQLGQETALANLDIGSGDEAASKQLARAMLPFVAATAEARRHPDQRPAGRKRGPRSARAPRRHQAGALLPAPPALSAHAPFVIPARRSDASRSSSADLAHVAARLDGSRSAATRLSGMTARGMLKRQCFAFNSASSRAISAIAQRIDARRQPIGQLRRLRA